MGQASLLLFMTFALSVVVVIVENWTSESGNAVTANQIASFPQDLLFVWFCWLMS